MNNACNMDYTSTNASDESTTNRITTWYRAMFFALAYSTLFCLSIAQNLPTILVQPMDLAVAIGGSEDLRMEVRGDEPITFYWYFNQTNLVQVGTNAILHLSQVSSAMQGRYTAVASNPSGSVTSRVASVVIGFPPQITANPSSQIVEAGTTASLGVAVNGTGPFGYRWTLHGTNLPNNPLSTVAGISNQTLFEGGSAMGAPLKLDRGIAVDNFGNIYLADRKYQKIRKIDTNGILTIIAGNGLSGFSGDGGTATNARLNTPLGLAIGINGDVFVSDTFNNRIRRVTSDGFISTFAGTDGGCSTCEGIPATNALLNSPVDLAVDPIGRLVFAEKNRVRRIELNGTIRTIAGNGVSGFSGDGGPATNASLSDGPGMCLDSNGEVLIADSGNQRVRRVDSTGIISTVAGGGGFFAEGIPATKAAIQQPSNVAIDPLGVIYISDKFLSRILRVSTNGNIGTFLAGISGDGSVIEKSGMLFVTEPGNQRVLSIRPDGVSSVVAGGYRGDGGPATNSVFDPSGLTQDIAGNLYIADQFNARIRKIDSSGTVTTFIGADQVGSTHNVGLRNPRSAAADISGDIYVADQFNNRILKANGASAIVPLNLQLPAPNRALSSPAGVGSDGFGNALITDSINSRILVITPEQMIKRQISTTVFPVSVVSDESGNLYFGTWGAPPAAYKATLDGKVARIAGGGKAYPGDGILATNAQLGGRYPSFQNSVGVTLNADGNLLIADTNAGRVRKIDSQGLLYTVAGGGTNLPVDGISPTNANIGFPAAVMVDLFGDLLIACQARGDGSGGGGWGYIRKVGGLPILNLKNVSFLNAGDYQVVVSNPYGSVTSSVATISVILPSLRATVRGSTISFGFGGIPNIAYTLETSTSLDPGLIWTSLSTNTPGTDGIVHFPDEQIVDERVRYFRVSSY